MNIVDTSFVQRQSSAAARLKLSGLSKKLGGALVVDNVELSVSTGESVVLLGPSGCGKSTTLRLIAGFIEPDSGEIALDGKIVSSPLRSTPTEHRNLGMVFQSYAVWPHKTVHQNVAFGLKFTNARKSEIRERVERVLDTVHLAGHADRYPGELSGGQQQRVALARAIVKEPNLLLLDEPLSNLDVRLREEMRTELKRLHAEIGMTMLYVTHDQDEALTLADRIAVMNHGGIDQFDTPEAIYRRPRTRFVASFVGTTNLVEVRVLARDAAAGRLQVQSALGGAFWARAHQDFVDAVPIGGQAAVSIRPEDLSLGGMGTQFFGHVSDASFLGNRYDLTMDVQGVPVRLHSRTAPKDPGEAVVIGFDPDTVWIVP
jgi:ABC-type Fe3+/spermidine/putrescine transport system ATPase subunit